MTAEQRAAEQAAELERMTTGEMTEREAIERAAAWKQAAQYLENQAEPLVKRLPAGAGDRLSR